MADLKRFADCENSVFISYAHADDELNNGWISHFAAELKRDLEPALARENKGRDVMRSSPGSTASASASSCTHILEPPNNAPAVTIS